MQTDDRVGVERCRHARAHFHPAAGRGRKIANRLRRMSRHRLLKLTEEPPQFLRRLLGVRIDKRHFQADQPQQFQRVLGGGRSVGRHGSLPDGAWSRGMAKSINPNPFF